MPEIDWFVVHSEREEIKVPQWLRTVAVLNGCVFVPAGIAANETAAVLSAIWGGVSTLSDGKHVYFPAWWMRREFPLIEPLCKPIERRLLSRDYPAVALRPGCPSTQRGEAIAFLRALLRDGPAASQQIKKAVRNAGLAWPTVRRAGEDLRGIANRIGGLGASGYWQWGLPKCQ